MIDRDKLVEDLGNVHDFLRAIEDPAADSVAVAAGIISGELEWKPAARLLTLEEVREWKGFLWIEFRGKAPEIAVVDDFPFDEGALRIYTARDLVMPMALNYGMNFRCWAEKPTPEDMEGAAWEAESDG